MPAFPHYQLAHRQRLQAISRSDEWRPLIDQGDLAELRAAVAPPPTQPAQQTAASTFLIRHNGPRVQKLIDEGVTDEDQLVASLGDWQSAVADGGPMPIVFLGLAVTMDCSFEPRCVYCNQPWLPGRLDLADWKALLTEAATPTPPYVYITGGEPLVLGPDVWGDDGLVAFAVKLGCAVNINTNAALITPQVAMQMTKIGLARLHVSLDCADPRMQDELLQSPGRTEEVLAGIYNVQIARELLGVDHPQIHVNCVLTSRNILELPELLRFLLDIRQSRPTGSTGEVTGEQLTWGEFAFHLIPIGGEDNARLRPSVEQWKRFYKRTWPAAEEIWQDYQAAAGVAGDDRKPLTSALGVAASPFLRVDHRMDLAEYCRLAADGEYWRGALSERCYVAGCQAFILPDGAQHWCGGHAVRRPAPLGNVTEATLRENIRENIPRLADCPTDACAGCAGVTCVINQSAASALRNQVRQWLDDRK